MTNSKKRALGRAIVGRAIIVAGLLLGAAAAHADWLVLTSGEAIETKGPWKLEKQKVVFTTTRGVLSSIRETSVNVDSSVALTAKKLEEATKPVVVAPRPKREPVLKLTDADIPKAKPPVAAPAEGAPSAPATGEAAAEPAAAGDPVVVPASDPLETRVARQMPGPPTIQITDWSARPTDEDQVSIFGTVKNVGSMVAAAITIRVRLINSEGGQAGSVDAEVSPSSLMPGVQADFEAKFEGDPIFVSVEFSTSTVELDIQQPQGGEPLEEPVDEEPSGDRASGDDASGDEPHATAAGASPKSPSG